MVQAKNMEQRSYIMLYFENDYCEGAHEAILKRLMETNMEKVPGYGQDPFCDKAKEKIKEACGCPDAVSYTHLRDMVRSMQRRFVITPSHYIKNVLSML